jgi:hypothetical protein
MHLRNIAFTTALFASVCAVGCGDARDVEVSGEVATASGIDASKPIRVEVYADDPETEANEAGEYTFVDAFELEHAGEFAETLSIEGESVLLVALADANGNGKCDDGEAWGEATSEVTDDKANVLVTVRPQQVCKDLPAAE